MSASHRGRVRNKALRELKRYQVSVSWENNIPVYRIRPEGFRTVLAELRGVAGASPLDVRDIGEALTTLSEVGAK